MKQLAILIIAYDWPPRNSIASHRPYAWAKYWSQAGASVTVLTAQKCAFDAPLDLHLPVLKGVKVIEVSYWPDVRQGLRNKEGELADLVRFIIMEGITFLKKIKTPFLRTFGLNVDIRDRWIGKSLSVAETVVSNEKIDVIVSTYGPRGCHIIASHLKNRFPNLKWVADYRDLWSDNHLSGMTRRQRHKERTLEKKVVDMSADLVTTVSEPLATSLRLLLSIKVDVVYNGYDFPVSTVEANLAKCKSPTAGRILNIIYTGMIYPGHRDPGILFESINQLTRSGEISSGQIEVHFYGARQPELGGIIERHSAESYVRIHGHVTWEVALSAQTDADLLLLLESGEESAKGVLTGKIFEYIASGTPILSLGSVPSSAIGELIEQCNVGIVCGNSTEKIKSVLRRVITSGSTGFLKPDLKIIEKYSREFQSNELLNKIHLLAHGNAVK